MVVTLCCGSVWQRGWRGYSTGVPKAAAKPPPFPLPRQHCPNTTCSPQGTSLLYHLSLLMHSASRCSSCAMLHCGKKTLHHGLWRSMEEFQFFTGKPSLALYYINAHMLWICISFLSLLLHKNTMSFIGQLGHYFTVIEIK